MKLSARYQAVYELISEIFKDQKPADNIINEYVRRRKYIGAKDRRFIVEMTWDILRRRMRLSFDTQSQDPRKILLYSLKDEDPDLAADGSAYGLAALSKEEKNWLKHLPENVYPEYVEYECPQWLFQKINSSALVQSLNQTAPADLRVNMADRSSVKKRLQSEGLFFTETPLSPLGLRSEERVNLNNCTAYQEGLIEVQDEASQLAAILSDISPDHKVIDYCAGAGGKSLAIAALNHNEGTIQAHDVNWHRMDVIKERAARLGIRNIQLLSQIEDTDYDCFLIDAPCSGSGTWRRSPDAKFRLTPHKLQELNQIQAEILEKAYKHTKPGGRIIYITCSVLAEENENIVQEFAAKHSGISFADHQQLWLKKIETPFPFNEKRFIRFSPLTTHTDGFFFCMMHKLK